MGLLPGVQKSDLVWESTIVHREHSPGLYNVLRQGTLSRTCSKSLHTDSLVHGWQKGTNLTFFTTRLCACWKVENRLKFENTRLVFYFFSHFCSWLLPRSQILAPSAIWNIFLPVVLNTQFHCCGITSETCTWTASFLHISSFFFTKMK